MYASEQSHAALLYHELSRCWGISAFRQLGNEHKGDQSGQEGITIRRWDCKGVSAERGAVIVDVDRFGAQHVLSVHFSCAVSTEQTQNQKQATIQG